MYGDATAVSTDSGGHAVLLAGCFGVKVGIALCEHGAVVCMRTGDIHIHVYARQDGRV